MLEKKKKEEKKDQKDQECTPGLNQLQSGLCTEELLMSPILLLHAHSQQMMRSRASTALSYCASAPMKMKLGQ